MGYRLEISKMKHTYCAGKMYGYRYNTEELKSYKWLLEHGFVTGKEEFWHYDGNPKIVLNRLEFKEFIKLYNEDLNNCNGNAEDEKDWLINDKEMQELINDNCDKVLEWF